MYIDYNNVPNCYINMVWTLKMSMHSGVTRATRLSLKDIESFITAEVMAAPSHDERSTRLEGCLQSFTSARNVGRLASSWGSALFPVVGIFSIRW